MGSMMLDPERDLKGATPETLALALLRPRHRRPVNRVREQQDDSCNRDRSTDEAPSEEPRS